MGSDDRPRARGSCAPRFKNALNVRPHPIAGFRAPEAGHEELVIVSVAVTHRGRDGKRHGVVVERPAGGAPADPPAAPSSGVGRDGLRPLRRTAGESRMIS
jgi:hypothetical protein